MNLRSGLPTILLLVSLAFMATVGTGLFRWLDRQMQGDVRRESLRLIAASGRIQYEIALEFAVLSALFTYAVEYDAEGAPSAGPPASLDRALQQWLDGTRFPDLIDTIYLVETTAAGETVRRYVAAERRFVAEAVTGSAAAPRSWAPDDGSGSFQIATDHTGLALVIPIQAGRQEGKRPVTGGRLVLVLDRDYLATRVVPELFARYLGARDGRYSFAVVAAGIGAPLFASASPPAEPDRIVPLTTWPTPNPLLRSRYPSLPETVSTLLPRLLSARLQDLLIRQWYGLDGDRDHRPGAAAGITPTEGISLHVWHRAGSIAAAMRQERNRRLGLGYAVLGAFAVVAIVYYLLYRRARELRDREHEFVATVTHELRTPVSAVRAGAENLAAGIVSDVERVKQYGRALLGHGRRLGELIDQVLLYAGLAGNDATTTTGRQPLAIEPLVRRVVDRVNLPPAERLTVTVQPDLPPYRGDALAVETIIGNLLSNAAKHAGEEAVVTLSVQREQQRRPMLVIKVADTGHGIPGRELGKVRQPFHRGAASRQRQTPGSGLGLSLVQRIVETYDGSLAIDSAPGRGTTVTARLPFANGGRP